MSLSLSPYHFDFDVYWRNDGCISGFQDTLVIFLLKVELDVYNQTVKELKYLKKKGLIRFLLITSHNVSTEKLSSWWGCVHQYFQVSRFLFCSIKILTLF